MTEKPKPKRKKINLKYRLDKSVKDTIIEFADTNAACFDIGCSKSFILKAGYVTVVETGLYVRVPRGYVLEIYPRSGVAKEYGVIILNSPGQIDAGYQDEVKILMTSILRAAIGIPLKIEKGSMIAQAKLVRLVPTALTRIETKEELYKNYPNRGGGFGSTGK